MKQLIIFPPFWQDEIIDEKEEIKLQRREIEMIIPQIEITSDDGFPSYISFSEVGYKIFVKDTRARDIKSIFLKCRLINQK